MDKQSSRFSPAEKDEIREIVVESMEAYFTSKGKTLKSLLLTTATILGSVAVIIAFVKGFLGYLGFQYIGFPK